MSNQTAKDFEWVIVDDGSLDDTRSIVDQWKISSDFPIKYLYKENGGKHTALNLGIKIIETDLTFIVDSDDELTPDAIETILKYYYRYGDKNNLCGYVFLRQYPDGKINGKTFEPNEKVSSYIETRINMDDTMSDKAEVFFTRCLKEFPFPEYASEKFLGEDIVWIRMARKYNMVHINKAIYQSSYLEDGLTKNRRRHNIESPIGCMFRAAEFLKKDINFKYRIKGAMQYIIYGKFAGNSVYKLMKGTTEKGLVLAFVLPALFLFIKWKRDYKRYLS